MTVPVTVTLTDKYGKFQACICRACRVPGWHRKRYYRRYLRQCARARKARRGWS